MFLPAGEEPAAAAARPPGAGVPLLDPAAFDRAAAAHLLWRTGFAPTPDEIDRCAALGIEKAVDRLLDFAGPDLQPFNPRATERPSKADLKDLSDKERQKKLQEVR